MYRYETVYILTPALSKEQAREATVRFRKILKDLGANIVHEESWGPGGAKKSTGYYQLIEFSAANGNVVSDLELSFKRDERVLRFLTVRLDKRASEGVKSPAKKSASGKKAITKKDTAKKSVGAKKVKK